MNFIVKKMELPAMMIMLFGRDFDFEGKTDIYWEILMGERLPKSNIFPNWRAESSITGTWFRFLVDGQEVLVRKIDPVTVRFMLTSTTAQQVLKNMMDIYGYVFDNYGLPRIDINQ